MTAQATTAKAAKYLTVCPACGNTFGVNAKHQVRQRARCLGCVRAANGWQHQPGCVDVPDHRGPCAVGATRDA